MATLLLSQGTPMVLAGDEIGNSQNGNNNAYAQDNEIAWINWAESDEEMLAFTKAMIAFRKEHPVLRQKLFLHSRERMIDGVEDLFWWREDATPMTTLDWHDPGRKFLAMEKRTAAGTPAYAAAEYAVLVVFNAGGAIDFKLPPAPEGQRWRHDIETASPAHKAVAVQGENIHIKGQSVSALVLVTDET